MSAGWIVLKSTGLVSASNFFTDVHTELLLLKHRGTANEELKEKLNVSPHDDVKSQEILLLWHLLEGMYHRLLTLNLVSISSHSKKKNPFGYFTYIGRYIKRVIQGIKSFYKHRKDCNSKCREIAFRKHGHEGITGKPPPMILAVCLQWT